MATALLSTQVPLPMVPDTALLLAGTPAVWTYIASGDFAGSAAANSQKSSVHGANVARYGAGIYAVGYGLTLTTAASLSLPVAAGQAIIDGVVEIAAATTYTVPNSTRSYIWLQRDGTLTHKTDLTQPTLPSVYLGSVLAAGGVITSVDDSGVLKFIGGNPVRQTADTDKPGDTPSASMAYYVKTAAGLWFWDGTEYRLEPHGILLGRTTIPASLGDGVPSNFEKTVVGPVTNLGTLYNFGTLTITG